uniref:SWIM-type domain-containing protein n=1 Tax=Ananas comosus var. bracteatus TaxID=296719 RepID=A0A6V7Q8K1_ANACO|nr:unnamed protein product [Ananas comosus var. bracteatus]
MASKSSHSTDSSASGGRKHLRGRLPAAPLARAGVHTPTLEGWCRIRNRPSSYTLHGQGVAVLLGLPLSGEALDLTLNLRSDIKNQFLEGKKVDRKNLEVVLKEMSPRQDEEDITDFPRIIIDIPELEETSKKQKARKLKLKVPLSSANLDLKYYGKGDLPKEDQERIEKFLTSTSFEPVRVPSKGIDIGRTDFIDLTSHMAFVSSDVIDSYPAFTGAGGRPQVHIHHVLPLSDNRNINEPRRDVFARHQRGGFGAKYWFIPLFDSDHWHLLAVDLQSGKYIHLSSIKNPKYNAGFETAVIAADRTDVVDLSKKTCFCKRWDIDGIPCNHAMAVISFRLRDPYDFVEDWFKTSTYRATYNDCVPPTRGKEQWHAIPSNVVPPRPPNVRIQPGRRKVSRRESIANGLIKKRCRNCQKWGHNKRSCKNPPVARANQPPATTSAGAPQETSKNPYVLL